MNIFYCQSEDMADFHILQGKLDHPTLIDKVCSYDYFDECYHKNVAGRI